MKKVRRGILSKVLHTMNASIEEGIAASFGDVLMQDRVSRQNLDIVVHARYFTKRTIDLLLGVLFLIISLPFMLVISAIIKLTSKGPIFFIQERVGLNGKPFKIIKFRTMKPENSQHDHREYVQKLLNGDKNEKIDMIEEFIDYLSERTTPIGRLLRATSLDELPQLLNILLGQMSLVGPRPHPVYEVKEYKAWYKRRLEVKPGLTGWSKLNLRLTPQNYEESILYDLWYVDHWNLWLDLKILFMTIPFILLKRDAH